MRNARLHAGARKPLGKPFGRVGLAELRHQIGHVPAVAGVNRGVEFGRGGDYRVAVILAVVQVEFPAPAMLATDNCRIAHSKRQIEHKRFGKALLRAKWPPGLEQRDFFLGPCVKALALRVGIGGVHRIVRAPASHTACLWIRFSILRRTFAAPGVPAMLTSLSSIRRAVMVLALLDPFFARNRSSTPR